MYDVRYVADDALPDDVDWVFVHCQDNGACYFLAKAHRLTAKVLNEAWAAGRMLERTLVPEQQRRRHPQLVSF